MGENSSVRTQFTRELHELTNSLTLMCRLAHDTVERGVDALAEADLAAAYEVFALEEQLRTAHRACETRTVALLALQAPVARDLRQVVTAMQIAGQLAKIGVLSSRVADQVYRNHPDHAAPQPILEVLTELGRAAVLRMAGVCATVAHGQLPAATAIAPEELRDRLHAALADPDHPRPPADVIDLALLGNNLERCVEHADRIDGLVRFLDSGVPPTAQSTDGEAQPTGK